VCSSDLGIATKNYKLTLVIEKDKLKTYNERYA